MSMQTTTIEVDQLTAARLQARAEAQGLTIADLLRPITELWNDTQEKSFYEMASLEERARALEEWASQRRSSAPPLTDDAISRDSIYKEREGKQL
jgi:phytoene dehydrogenase-like protein